MEEITDIVRTKYVYSKGLVLKYNLPLKSMLRFPIWTMVSAFKDKIILCHYVQDLIYGCPMLGHLTRNRLRRYLMRQYT